MSCTTRREKCPKSLTILSLNTGRSRTVYDIALAQAYTEQIDVVLS